MTFYKFAVTFLIGLINNSVAANQLAPSSYDDTRSTRDLLKYDSSLRSKTTMPEVRFDSLHVRIFENIGRQHIDENQFVDPGIEMDVACDCPNQTFEASTGILVAEERPLDSQSPRSTTINKVESKERSFKPREHYIKHIGTPLIKNISLLPSFSDFPNRLSESNHTQALEILGQQLSRAVAQGLVVTNKASDELKNYEEVNRAHNLESRSNLSISTSVDAASVPFSENRAQTDSGVVCYADAYFDVSAWGSADATLGVGKYRSNAFAEDGSLDENGALALARYYLSLGFGAEAALVGQHTNFRERTLLTVLADIMDQGYTSSSLLDGQLTCRGKVSFWALLASPLGALDRVAVPVESILRTLSALPPHLRGHLGPLLSKRLREAGLAKEAEIALTFSRRAGQETNAIELEAARLELSGSTPVLGRERLEVLIVSNDQAAASALLELLLDAEDREMAPNPDWVLVDAPALVRATTGTPIAARLDLARIRGLIVLGHFDEFRDSIIRQSPGLNIKNQRMLSLYALQEAAKSASDDEFLRTEIGLSSTIETKEMTDYARSLIAKKLTSLGLPFRATKYLSEELNAANDTSLAVEVFLATGQVHRALEIASAQQDGTHHMLGKLFQALGDEESALRAFHNSHQTDEALNSATLAGNWDWIIRNFDNEISTALQSLRGLSPAHKNGEKILKSRKIRKSSNRLIQLSK